MTSRDLPRSEVEKHPPPPPPTETETTETNGEYFFQSDLDLRELLNIRKFASSKTFIDVVVLFFDSCDFP
jgi:hypothetical protein